MFSWVTTFAPPGELSAVPAKRRQRVQVRQRVTCNSPYPFTLHKNSPAMRPFVKFFDRLLLSDMVVGWVFGFTHWLSWIGLGP